MVDGQYGEGKMSVKIIAEIGVNHNGSVELALQHVDAANKAGADLVKFQTFTAKRLASRNTPKVPYQLRTSDPQETHYDMLKKLELSLDAHKKIKAYCDNLGIGFCSTPYSREDAIFLSDIGVTIFKVASADIVDRLLLEYIADAGHECIISTGMATMQEIEDAVSVFEIENRHSKIVLLQCTSAYPANPADANLLVMHTFKKTFGCGVGFSDHTIGNECAIAATALGATVIEKHFTLDKFLPGPDHVASASPMEFAALVKAVRLVEQAVGDGVKTIAKSERDMRNVSRKSIVAARDLPAGHHLQIEDIHFQRPGSGISPMKYPDIIGRKLIRKLEFGEPLSEEILAVI